MKLRFKLTLLCLVVAIIPIAIVGSLAYMTGRWIIEQSSINNLLSINILKSSELHRWMEGNKNSIKELAQRPLVRQNTASIMSHDVADSGLLKVKENLIADHLLPRLENGNFSELFVLSPIHGIIMASTNSVQEGKYRNTRAYFIEGKKQTYIQGAYYSQGLEEIYMTVSSPILDSQGNLIAVLAGRLDLSELSKIMLTKSGESRTEDTYLVNHFNFFVTEPRFGRNFALKKAVRTEGVAAGLAGKDGVGFYRDYRGEAVIGAYKWLPQYRMCIITERDQKEIYEPIIQFGRIIISIGALTALAVVILAVFISRTLTRPIRKLVEGAEEIGRGNLDHIVGTTTRDEIGELSRTFDRMTQALKKTTVSRDALQQEKRFSDSVIDSFPGIFYLFDEKGRFIRWNRNFEKVTEYPAEMIPKISPLDLFSGEDQNRVAAKIQNIFIRGEDFLEADLISRSGKKTPYYLTGLNVSINDKTLLIGTGMDITERRLAEARLGMVHQELQRSNSELEQFAYVASHDLQEPLRMVSSFTQLLARRYADKLDQDAMDFIHYAVDGANRMQQLIQDLLSFSRVTTRGQPRTRIHARDALENALSNLQTVIAETGARITHDDLAEVDADRTQLVQVFQNLIGNAVKFGKSGESPSVHISCQQQGAEWVFSVKDNGIGINPKYFDRIFVIFQRLHTREAYSGSGIGLALCKSIVERHAGRIWVESQPDKGSIFRFTIPIQDMQKGDKSS
jgi:PAS domain S-box-containing protein